jgi:hypothetical protein
MDYLQKQARSSQEGETGTTETRNFWMSPLLLTLVTIYFQ